MIAYFHLAIYLKSFMFAFEGVFPKIDKIYSVISFNFAFVVIVIFFIINLETAVTFGERILPFAIIFPYFVLPVFVLIELFLKRKDFQKNAKNTGNLQKKQKNYLKKQRKTAFLDTKFEFFVKKAAKKPHFSPKIESVFENEVKIEKKNVTEKEKKKILKKPQKTAFFEFGKSSKEVHM